MSSNDRIILDQILDEKRASVARTLSESSFFELFTAEQILKEYDLSYEEIEAGIVGDGGDGGIDSVYVFANGELVQDDTDLSALKKGVTLDLVIIQAKTSAGFGETAIDKLVATTEDLLNLSHKLEIYKTSYNEGVRDAIDIFRRAYRTLAARFPAVNISFYYATKGAEVHPNTRARAERVRAKVKTLFSDADFSFHFLGARELLQLARRTPRTTHTLSLAETPISSAGEVGFVCLVKLRDYYAFITENGILQRGLFEANVRDYQGSTQVNEEIHDSLMNLVGREDFWWLNNGITVVASKATQSGKALTIEDPQIVNGLQTSTEIYKYFASSAAPTQDERTLLVRVIVPTDPASRDRIIKATNSQTYIPPASLRATDKIHRDIEEYLKPHGLFYDRRKNAYKNEGFAVERIVGIPYMAQAVMAIVLQRPDNARSRPSSLLKKDEDYRSIFNPAYPIEIYRFCAGLMKIVESHLREHTTLSQQDRGNVRFHVGMFVAAQATRKVQPLVGEIAKLDLGSITTSDLQDATTAVLSVYQQLGGSDSVAKGSDFVTRIRETLRQKFPPNDPAGTAQADA